MTGEKDGRRLRSFIPDQRVMHRPWMSFLNENETIISTIYGTSKPLQHVSLGPILLEIANAPL